ncbi:chemotaxis protein, partial [Campylobacter jejuni]|nr:chemotaxis protein [Campylobacter jejuni]HED6109859.1 chemotaxis protein [Campylobacter jejuni]
MFGSKINHSDLQKLEEENKNLTHKIEKFQSENLELKN